MKRSAEDAEKTREGLLEAALQVFLRKGYADTRIEDICKEGGVTRGAFYHYFPSKKDMYYALLEERLAPAQAVLGKSMQSGASPLETVRNLLVQFLSLMKNDRGFRDANELTLMKTGYVEELQDGMSRKVEGMRNMVFLLEGLLEKAVSRNEIVLSQEVRAAALHLYGAMTGALTLWLLDDSFFSYPDDADRYVDMWMAGIRQ